MFWRFVYSFITDKSRKSSKETEGNAETGQKSEKPLDEDMAQIFGKDPKDSGAVKIDFHSCVLSRWKHWFDNRISKEEKEELLKTYDNPTVSNLLKFFHIINF